MVARFPSTWQRYFAQPAASAPSARPPFRRVPLVPPSASSASTPPSRPTPPVDRRPLPPEPPRRPLELAWLTWQVPAQHQQAIIFNLRQTLDWRAQYCQPLDEPKASPEYARFGLLGEQLCPCGVDQVYHTLDAELRESMRTLEGAQSRTERNRRLAMHSVRLGQVCAELEQRGVDSLERVRCSLTWLWV